VSQTLEFALSTKTPAKRAEGVSKKEFNSTVLQSLLKMLNISHTSSTLVGDAVSHWLQVAITISSHPQFVRGVSGGERKRVSIAEMMTTRARVQAWDGSTRGLDAATAVSAPLDHLDIYPSLFTRIQLDFVKCLRIMTDVLGQTTFVSL
jgi:ATP-binding cassette, subfamily G (WHITE), member 2, SNQ2